MEHHADAPAGPPDAPDAGRIIALALGTAEARAHARDAEPGPQDAPGVDLEPRP